MRGKIRHTIKTVAGCGLLMLFTACNGLFDDIYDTPTPMPEEQNGEINHHVDSTAEVKSYSVELYVDASSWTQWHYLDLHALRDSLEKGKTLQSAFTTFDIPLDQTAAFDADGTGIYTYWYDVFGEGISKREFREKYPTAVQPAPDHWDLAFHRNNVRTNGGSAAETELTDISKVVSHGDYATLAFAPDEWDESNVWTVQARMLQGLVGNQRIRINPTLARMLRLDIPPMPPAFTHNDHVFIVRFADDTYAAVQLKNYLDAENVKCKLTIECKYPI